MFVHSVRVPRHFKIAANIVQKFSEEGGSVKTLLYDNKLKHFRTSVLYALINESIKHAVDIEKMFESTGILVNEPRLDPWLAKVLTAELIYGKKSLPGKSKPEQTILSYRERFEKIRPEVQDDQTAKVVRRPRYVRVNTNLLTTSDAIRAFQDDGYKFIRCTSGSYNDYLQQIQNLTEYDFTQDYHVKTIFVFSPGTKLHEHDLYLENKIILQDKATALAVHLLAPPTGSVVLDMCAAPGMKTTQLAAYLRNQGKIYAVERNEKRYETLCQYVKTSASTCVETLLKDALEIKRGDLDDVEYILLDPSCSGSGMELSVHKYIDATRLAKLTSLQEKFLKHAMNSFPNAKRIVYSTCSMFSEENERVVTNIVKASRAKWRVQDVKELLKDQWNNFGSGMYGSMGTRCLYAKPDSDFTTGFFLAVLDRDLRESEKQQDENQVSNGNDKIERKLKAKSEGNEYANDANEKSLSKKKSAKVSPQDPLYNKNEDNGKSLGSPENTQSVDTNDEVGMSKKKKKKHKKLDNETLEPITLIDSSTNIDSKNTSETNMPLEKNDDKEITKKMKRKRKDRYNESLEAVTETLKGIASDTEQEKTSKKGKKIKKQKETSVTLETVKDQLNNYNDDQLLEDIKNDNETPKTKKKKQKLHKDEVEETITDAIVIDDSSSKVEKKSKKKKKDLEHLNSDLSLCDPTQELDGVKKRKTELKDLEILENNQSCEVPKKKKKKRESEIR